MSCETQRPIPLSLTNKSCGTRRKPESERWHFLRCVVECVEEPGAARRGCGREVRVVQRDVVDHQRLPASRRLRLEVLLELGKLGLRRVHRMNRTDLPAQLTLEAVHDALLMPNLLRAARAHLDLAKHSLVDSTWHRRTGRDDLICLSMARPDSLMAGGSLSAGRSRPPL